MPVSDLAGYRYVQARGYSVGRPDGPPRWIVWHSMETDELPTSAEACAGYFGNPGDGRDVSSHWCIDNNSAVQCVREQDSAWTVGNRPGNMRGINIELAGRARQTRAQWLDSYGLGLFATAAPVVAAAMTRWNIPNRWCSDADLRAGRAGHTTHADMGRVFGGTDHTDPGGGFPRDHVLAVVAGALAGKPTVTPPGKPTTPPGEADMSPEERYVQHVMNYRLEAILAGRAEVNVPEFWDGERKRPALKENNQAAKALGDLLTRANDLLGRPPVASAPVDPAVVQAAVLAALATLLADLAASVARAQLVAGSG